MARFGSLQNHLIGHATGMPIPKVGDGATIIMWSDRKAATIVRVSPSGKSVWIQQDHAKRVDPNGMSECQEYAYTPNPDAPEREYRLRNGRWKQVGGSHGLLIGERREYHDFSF